MKRFREQGYGLAALLWFCVPSIAFGADLVLLRDGSRRSGDLRACAGGRCSLGGQSVEQSAIAWIGLEAAPDATPPAAPRAAASDAVILRDGRVIAETVVGVSLGSVAMEESEFERSEVAWICFDCASITSGAVPAPVRPGTTTAPRSPRSGGAAVAASTPPRELASGLPGVPDDPPPSPRPAPRPAGPPTVLLNEVLFLAPAGSLPFVELRNATATKVRLEGFSLLNQSGAVVTLPPSATIDANGVTLVPLGAAATSFLAVNGWVALRKGEAELDRVAWGEAPGGVRMTRGGIVDDAPAPGSTVGRLPRSTAWGPREWVLYEPGEATPGAPNQHPAVTILLPPDGASVPPSKVTLHWYPVPGAARYRVQLGGDRGLGTPLVDKTVDQPPLEVTLATGAYFWRVQAINAAGEGAPFSPVAILNVTARASLARLAAAARGFVHASAAAEEVPYILDVPMIKQHKDTAMLQLEDWKEGAAHAWDSDHGDLDTTDPADAMNCASASIAMMNAFYGGRLSQDRINYEVHKGRAPGPQWDLNWGLGLLYDESAKGLTFALGAEPAIHPPPSDALFASALLGARLEVGIPIMVSLARPHAVVVSGYLKNATGVNEVIVNDPWVGKYVAPETLITGARWWRSMVDSADGVEARPVAPRSDEPEVSQDSDGDGLVDFDEIHRFRTHPHLKDSDQDGVEDKADIRASVMDERHGYALGGGGRDYDGDGKAMELDSDSDNGGCLDGLEDHNRNGKFEPRGGILPEHDNFTWADDACWTGTFELVLDQRNEYEGGDWTHQRHRSYGQYSVAIVPGGQIGGRAQLTTSLWGRAVNEICPGSFQYDFEWSADLVGESQALSDGRGLVSFKATPERGPDFMFTWNTPCPAEPTRFDGVSFPGYAATFNEDQDEIDERFDVAHDDPAILEFFYRHTMRRIGRPGR